MFTASEQPSSFFGILSHSLQIYKSVLIKILPFSLLYVLIESIPSFALLHIHSQKQHFSLHSIVGIALLSALLIPWIAAVIYMRIYLAMTQDARGYGAALKIATQKYPTYLITSIIYFIIVLVGSLLLVFPGIFWSICFCFYFLAILIDQCDVVESLKYSAKLVKHHWWRTFFLIAIPSIIVASLLKVIGLFSRIPLVFIDRIASLKIIIHSHCITLVVMTLIQPWIFSLMLCLYFDLKLRCSKKNIINY